MRVPSRLNKWALLTSYYHLIPLRVNNIKSCCDKIIGSSLHWLILNVYVALIYTSIKVRSSKGDVRKIKHQWNT